MGRGFVDLAMALLVFLYNNVYICFLGDISILSNISSFGGDGLNDMDWLF